MKNMNIIEFHLKDLYACKWYQFSKKRQIKYLILIELSRDWVSLVVETYNTRDLLEKYNKSYNIR